MSAVTWGECPSFDSGAALRRPPLRSVPTRALPSPPAAGPGVYAADVVPGRLTRRGRLALSLTAATAVVAFGVLDLGAAAADVPAHTVTVRAGETLSDVAHRELPGASIAEAVVALQIANGMNGTSIGPGAVLTIPAH